MAPVLAQFEQAFSSTCKLVKIDLDQRDSQDMQTYGKFMDSQSIPYTVVLRGERVVFKKVGGLSVEELKAATEIP